jgi:hypothetical protein
MLRMPRLCLDFNNGERGLTKAAAVVGAARAVRIGVNSFDGVDGEDVMNDFDRRSGSDHGPTELMNEFDSNFEQVGRFERSRCMHRDRNSKPSWVISEGSVGLESAVAM